MDQALTETELDQLALILERLNEQEFGMSLSMVDGFFTALAMSPESVSPTEWFTWVVSDLSQVPDEQELQMLLSLLIRHCHQVQNNLRHYDPPYFDPIYLYREDQETPWVAEWCHGFVGGVNIRSEAWESALTHESDMMLLELLVGLSTLPPPDEPMLEDQPTTSEYLSPEDQAILEAQQLAILALEEYRHNIDPIANWDVLVEVTVLSLYDHLLHPMVQDACPCGSGKSFKLCCGASDRKLH